MKYGKKYFLLIMLAACCSCSFAQVHNIGRIISYKKVKTGIEGTTPTAVFAVHAWSNNIIRVSVSKTNLANNLSYALIRPQPVTTVNVNVEDKGSSIVFSTKAISVEIEKTPSFRVIFKNSRGELINEDVAGSCFGTTFIGDKVSVYKKLQEGERFVGMGEALGNLDKRGTGITLNNTDTYKYGDPRLSMYVSVPFYIGLHHQQAYGIFYNNSYRSFFNFGLSTPDFTSVNMEGGNADYFFMYDESVANIITHYTSLTGRIQLPPLWSIGYHQSRCSYYPQDKVEWIAETFRKKKIPLDCIVLDADYQQGYQPFRVNKQRFPDMPALAASLAKKNIELTASVYPGVAIDSSYHSYVDGLKQDVFVKYANGSLFNTEIAPVKCYLPDYTNPRARAWWKEKMKWLPDNGIHGYWNDMNEPALGGSYLPDNLLFDFDGKKANALEAKNLYGFQMARSSYEAAQQNSTNLRPFILTRSGFAGVQRYAAVWSGDNTSNDEGLLSGVLLNSQLGLSGISFCGYDIGGFIGDGSKELYQRWIQVGVFSPFCRNHKGCGGTAGEPWAYGDEAEIISKNFINLRYRLLPYLYAAFYEATQTGMPVARSLCINYPFDDRVFDNTYQHQFLFGPNILVVPVTSQEAVKKVYLPAGKWYHLETDELLEGKQELNRKLSIYELPLYARASAIIPMQGIVQSTKELPVDTLVIHLFNGDEKNTFSYYEDDGATIQYQQAQFCKKEMNFNPAQKQFNIQPQTGEYPSHFRHLQIVFHGFAKSMNMVKVNNNETPLTEGYISIIGHQNEQQYLPGANAAEQINAKQAHKIITIPNSAGEINIHW
jgi:alpha-glucosidase